MYFIEKNINKFRKTGCTYFLDPKELMLLKGKLKKEDYSIYYPYKDSEKVIVYKKDIPEVLLYEIKIGVSLRHQDILGSMYSLDIAKELYGDIVLIDGRYYIYILPIIRNYFESNFLMVRNSSVTLEEIDINTFKDYERSYKELELIVSSNRIDTIVSNITHSGRNNINDKIKNKEIILNYDYLKNSSYRLKEGDTFSIKKIGKYKYMGILKNTRSGNIIVKVLKYI